MSVFASMGRVMVKLALAAMLLVTAPLATAAPCAGFTDVSTIRP